jgi:hypothetical protein
LRGVLLPYTNLFFLVQKNLAFLIFFFDRVYNDFFKFSSCLSF